MSSEVMFFFCTKFKLACPSIQIIFKLCNLILNHSHIKFTKHTPQLVQFLILSFVKQTEVDIFLQVLEGMHSDDQLGK